MKHIKYEPKPKASDQVLSPAKSSESEVVKRSVFWKVYFWGYVISLSSGYLQYAYLRLWEAIDMVFTAGVAFGLYAFVWQKDIFNKLFWRVFFTVTFVWYFVYSFIIEQHPTLKSMLDVPGGNVLGLASSGIVIPAFVALYLSAYTNKKYIGKRWQKVVLVAIVAIGFLVPFSLGILQGVTRHRRELSETLSNALKGEEAQNTKFQEYAEGLKTGLDASLGAGEEVFPFCNRLGSLGLLEVDAVTTLSAIKDRKAILNGCIAEHDNFYENFIRVQKLALEKLLSETSSEAFRVGVEGEFKRMTADEQRKSLMKEVSRAYTNLNTEYVALYEFLEHNFGDYSVVGDKESGFYLDFKTDEQDTTHDSLLDNVYAAEDIYLTAVGKRDEYLKSLLKEKKLDIDVKDIYDYVANGNIKEE